MSMVTLKIDGTEVQASEHDTILQVAQRLGIYIPTLCCHAAIPPYGACRVCIVEILHGKTSKLVTACTYPVWEGLEVRTGSDRAIAARKFIISVLLARCPGSAEIKELAEKVGASKGALTAIDESMKCILCGLCVRICDLMIGKSAISFANRGIERAVQAPFDIESEDCIGCGACAFVCPTGVIRIEDAGSSRTVLNWRTTLERVKCKGCNKFVHTEKTVEYAKNKIGLREEYAEYCSECRRKNTVKNLA